MLPKLIFVAVILFCGSTCDIQAFELPQVSSQRASQGFQCPHLIGDIAGSGSFVAALDGNGPNVRTFKLSPKYDFYDNFSSEAVDSGGYAIDTNSQWYSYLHPSGYSLLWQVSSHGFVYNEQRIQNPGGIFAKLLESSYIVVTANTLDTYRYNSSYLWTLDNSFKFQNNTLDSTLPLFGISQVGDAFAILDSTSMNIQLYSRLGWSWRYVDSMPLVATLGIPRAVVPIGYGNKQVIVSYANPSQNTSIPSGAVVVHVKTIGYWRPIVIKASDLGIKPPGEFGSALLAIDPKRMLVSAPKSGYNENTQTGGQVFILSQFLNGSWGVIKELVTRDQPKILYGTGLALTSTDVIIAAGQSSFAGNYCYLYSVPLYKII